MRPRITGRLENGSGTLTLISALAESAGSVSLHEFQTMLANLYDSKYRMRDTKAQLIADNFIEVRVHLTPVGAAALAKKLNPTRKRSCAKRAPTAAPKATEPTAAPFDSTPLAMAWMGHR